MSFRDEHDHIDTSLFITYPKEIKQKLLSLSDNFSTAFNIPQPTMMYQIETVYRIGFNEGWSRGFEEGRIEGLSSKIGEDDAKDET